LLCCNSGAIRQGWMRISLDLVACDTHAQDAGLDPWGIPPRPGGRSPVRPAWRVAQHPAWATVFPIKLVNG